MGKDYKKPKNTHLKCFTNYLTSHSSLIPNHRRCTVDVIYRRKMAPLLKLEDLESKKGHRLTPKDWGIKVYS